MIEAMLASSNAPPLLAVGYATSPYLKVYDMADKSLKIGTPTLAGAPASISFSPNNAYLAVAFSGNFPLAVYDASTWAQVAGTPNAGAICSGVEYSPDGQYIALVVNSGLLLYRTSDWSVVTVTGAPTFLRGVSWSPDGTLLAVTHYDTPGVFIFETTNWTRVGSGVTIAAAGGPIRFSPDSKFLVVGGFKILRTYRVSDWSIVVTRTLNGSNQRAMSIDISRDNKTILYGVDDAAPFLRMGYLESPNNYQATPILTSTGRAVAYNDDGEYLAVGASPFLDVWSKDGGPVPYIETTPGGAVTSLAFTH